MPPTDKDRSQFDKTGKTPDESSSFDSQKPSDIPSKDGSYSETDENVKGGRMKQRPSDLT